ncbi:zinc finger protein 2-like [Wyeomyia smithii]|uniref:zinc finger protein 2-like n=1 Tax=Wyeomyia smithii TaxID=174621 RepID=UPI002467E8DD|nr:zinc finger protein 2-like [Wyeomyia smithii]
MDTLQLPAAEDPCRLCLRKCEQAYGLYVNSPDGLLRELPKKILECIALEISDSEPPLFSKIVCSECICKLDYFHEFRENCRKCQTFFNEMMMFCQAETVADNGQNIHQHHPDVHQQILPEINFTGHDFMLDGTTNKDYEYIIQSLEKEDISFTSNAEALKLKKELEISIQQNQHDKFIPMVVPSTSESVIPSEETCFNNLEAIVESIAQVNDASNYIIEQGTGPEDDLDYDAFVGIETVDDNRDASISEIHVQEIIEEHKLQSPPEENVPLMGESNVDNSKEEEPAPIEPEPPAETEELPVTPTLNDRTCDLCGKVCSTRTKLKIHRNTHLNVTPFACPIENCSKAFKSKSGLDEHVAKHTGNYQLSCGVCGKGFAKQSYLTTHQRTHSNERTFRCNICKQATFKTKKSLIDHKNRHLGLKPFECNQCEKQFTNRYLLQQHEQSAHSGVRFQCPQCEKSFTCKSYLKVHLRIHNNDRPFVCEVCQWAFVTRRDLEVHRTVHTGKKEFVCDVCGKGFSRLSALTFHRRTHEKRPKAIGLEEGGVSGVHPSNF